jgi:16S rRNA C967 or C1407 C5-methylase (RsmB/RsmF family)/NOL1/NOP2/fmu family ribosome biogenesis protein
VKNLPVVLLNELRNINGFDEASFIAAHQQLPVTSVRINPGKQSNLFGTSPKVPWCENGIYLPERPVFTLDPAFHAGAYYVQEASSMFLDHLLRSILPERNGLRVLDLCAAPGGKSTLIASLLGKDSLLISNDVIRNRATILDENMTRWGYMNTWVSSNDPRDFGKLSGYFDVIVVDAPCSGSGLFRKDERALNDWTEANVKLCCERQQRILTDVWPALKQDGILVYATCSYSQKEDEDILDWLATNYFVQSLEVPVKEEWGIVTTRSPEKNVNGYRFFPGKVAGEGFFIAALRKKEGADSLSESRFKSGNDKKIQQMAGYLLSDPDSVVYIKTDNEHYGALNPLQEQDFQFLQKAVYFRKAGLKLGAPAGKDWVPAHEVALSIDASDILPGLDVNKDQALHFLKREEMGVGDLPKGWLLVKYDGLGLGWVKSLGNRVNNYFPKHWRIRMELPENE